MWHTQYISVLYCMSSPSLTNSLFHIFTKGIQQWLIVMVTLCHISHFLKSQRNRSGWNIHRIFLKILSFMILPDLNKEQPQLSTSNVNGEQWTLPVPLLLLVCSPLCQLLYLRFYVMEGGWVWVPKVYTVVLLNEMDILVEKVKQNHVIF